MEVKYILGISVLSLFTLVAMVWGSMGVSPLYSFEVDMLCNETESILYRNDTTWSCGTLPVYNQSNVTGGDNDTLKSVSASSNTQTDSTYTLKNNVDVLFETAEGYPLLEMVESTNKINAGGQFQAISPFFPVLKFTRTTTLSSGSLSTLTGIASAMELKTQTSASAGEGFGGGIVFRGRDSSGTDNILARIYMRRGSNDNSGHLQLWTGATGQAEVTHFDENGNVGFNGNVQPNAPIDVLGSNSAGLSAYFEHNISVEDIIYHSDVNKDENVLETFNNDYLDENGNIDHSKDEYAVVTWKRNVTDYSRPVIETVYANNETYTDDATITTYPYTIEIEERGWSASKRDAKYEKAFSEINEAFDIIETENGILLDTDIISAETIYTESKTADASETYLERFDSEIFDKTTHPAYEADVEGQGRLNFEDRMVNVEGAVEEVNRMLELQQQFNLCVVSSNNVNKIRQCVASISVD